MGRSRGGLTTKLHLLAEGRGRSLVRRLTPGQSSDTKELVPLLDLGMRLGEGSGAVAAVPLVRAAAALLGEMALLADLQP